MTIRDIATYSDEDPAKSPLDLFNRHVVGPATSLLPLIYLSSLIIAFNVTGNVQRWGPERRVAHTMTISARLTLGFYLLAVLFVFTGKVHTAIVLTLGPFVPILPSVFSFFVGIFWWWMLLAIGNLFATAFSYLYGMAKEAANDPVGSPANWFSEILDIRRARVIKGPDNSIPFCQFTTGISEESTELRTIQVGEQPEENVAGKLQWSMEKLAENSKSGWDSSFFVTVLKAFSAFLSLGTSSLEGIVSCTKLVTMKLISNLSGVNFAKQFFESVMAFALPPDEQTRDPKTVSLSRYVHDSGLWCERRGFTEWLSSRYENDKEDSKYNIVLGRTATMAGYNTLSPNRLAALQSQTKGTASLHASVVMLTSEFVTKLPEKNQVIGEIERYLVQMDAREKAWFTYGEMNYEYMESLGMKTSHLKTNEAGGATGTADDAAIDEAIGVGDVARQRIVLGRVKLVTDINCAEFRNSTKSGRHPCCVDIPGPPMFEQPNQYKLQSVKATTKYIRNFPGNN